VFRLFSNLAALKKMKERRRKVGKLRFKGERWFKTFTYNQSGFKLLPRNDKFGFLHLSKTTAPNADWSLAAIITLPS
jgi:putative transposase